MSRLNDNDWYRIGIERKLLISSEEPQTRRGEKRQNNKSGKSLKGYLPSTFMSPKFSAKVEASSKTFPVVWNVSFNWARFKEFLTENKLVVVGEKVSSETWLCHFIQIFSLKSYQNSILPIQSSFKFYLQLDDWAVFEQEWC